MFFKLSILCTVLSLHCALADETLREVTYNFFIENFGTRDFFIILFTKRDCKACKAMEAELLAAKGELEFNLHAAVAKIYDSKNARKYIMHEEPAMVFFRYGVPLLYHGEVDKEHIIHYFIENRKPTVKELTDDNFEFTTQAYNTRTGGDWFIMFYGQICFDSIVMTPAWEAVGAALRAKMDVARICVDDYGVNTAKRFGVTRTPTFILVHNGNMYTYKSEKLDVDSLVSFARNFKQLPSVRVPPAPGILEDFINRTFGIFDKDFWFIRAASLGFFLGALGASFMKCLERQIKKEMVEEEEEEEEEGEEKGGEEEEEEKEVETVQENKKES